MSAKKTEFKTAFPLNLSNQQLVLIGAFIVSWNQVELLMDVAVGVALGTTGSLVEEIMSSPNIIPKTRILVEAVKATVTDLEIQKATVRYANEIASLSNFRNSIAHGFWAQNEATGEPGSKKSMLSRKVVNLSEIDEKLSQVCLLTMKMADLFWRIAHFKKADSLSLPSPWHGKF